MGNICSTQSEKCDNDHEPLVTYGVKYNSIIKNPINMTSNWRQIKEEEYNNDTICKIIIMGNSSSGKTLLCSTLIKTPQNVFPLPYKNEEMTIGIKLYKFFFAEVGNAGHHAITLRPSNGCSATRATSLINGGELYLYCSVIS